MFIRLFFLTFFLFFSLSVALITGVDPYDRLGNNIFGFKTKAVAQSRENKFRMFDSSKKEYEAFILGSSAAHRYRTKTVEELTGLKTYNYAVQHSTPIDFLAITKHILSKSQPKLVLLQLDFSVLDENYSVDNRLFNSPLKKYLQKDEVKESAWLDNNYFTLEALIDSFRVFYVNYFGKARHIYLEDGNYIYKQPKKVEKIRIRAGSSVNYKFSKQRYSHLLQIKNLIESNGGKLIIFLAPVSYGHYKKVITEEKPREIHQDLVKSLSSDFSNFHNFQTEWLKDYNSYLYYHDSLHPTHEMSDIVLNKILTN